MDHEAFRVRWCEVDERIAQFWPSAGRVARTSEHASIEGRTLEVVVGECDPIAELERLIGTASGFRLEVYDRGVLAKRDGITVCAHGEPRLGTYEVLVEIEQAREDVRDELERYPQLAPLEAIAELGLRVLRVERAAHTSFTVALDAETRHGLIAWLHAQDYVVLRGTTSHAEWTKGELVVVIEHAAELGVDEATAFVRPQSRRRTLAHGTDAEGVALPIHVDDVEVVPAQIVEEIAAAETTNGPERPV